MKELELNQTLNRYYFLIKTFEKVVDGVNKEMRDSNKWFVFCGKIGKKFLTHLKSYVFNVTQGLKKIEIDNIVISEEFDISVLYSNLRMQIDTYSTFHHLFLHDGDWEEKIIRFRLWQMDSLISRQNFSHNLISDKLEQYSSEKDEINEIYDIVNSFDFYKNLTDSKKNRLLRKKDGVIIYANWKFDKSLLSGKKEKYSWEELTLNSGIKKEIYSDMHNFTSMHVHSNYISILQNDQLIEDEKHGIRIVGIMLSSYLICLFLDDLCNRFVSAQKVSESLTANEIEIIKSFLKTGRETDKIKYYA
jgi:hypothetical protein